MELYILTRTCKKYFDTSIIGVFSSIEMAINALNYKEELWDRREKDTILWTEESIYHITPFDLDKSYEKA
jgi:hypothetical protein